MPEHKDNPHSHETTTPLYRSGSTKVPLTLSSLKKWVPDGTCGHELARPKRVSWLPAYGRMSATSIHVSCEGVKTHVFMDDSIGLHGGGRQHASQVSRGED